MVLRPLKDPNTHLTPSPVTDTFTRTGSKLLELRLRKAAESFIAEDLLLPNEEDVVGRLVCRLSARNPLECIFYSNWTDEKEVTVPIPCEQLAAVRILLNKLEQ